MDTRIVLFWLTRVISQLISKFLDFVSNPSTHGAFLSPVNEGKNSKTVTDKYSNVNKIITDIIKEF